MILRPRLEDIKIIGYYLGKVIIGLGFIMLVPAMAALSFAEINPLFDCLIGAEITLILGLFLTWLCATDKDLNWSQGLVVTSLSWLVAMALSAIPFFLSGHWQSYLDAIFEAMSAFTTSGLFLAQDIDHLSKAINLWRHFAMFIGGQGIVVVALTFLVKGASGAFKIYVGEGREERLLPNVIGTARFILLISMAYLIIGTFALWLIGMWLGLAPLSALFHGLCIFMAAFSTGGFSPTSLNILYYHSFAYEIATIILLLMGALNFNLHYCLWRVRRREIAQNIETRTMFITVMLTFLLLAAGLSKLGVYPGALVLFRKGFYQLISGHTTTGFSTIYARQFINEWGNLALLALTLAMALGACVCSTGGGIKMFRVGVVFKALYNDVKRVMLPESAVFVERFHHLKDLVLTNTQVRSAALIFLCYIGLYIFGAAVGMLLGYPGLEAIFESTSAAANVGLSCGITQASMPAALKITYIFQMWAGRLEFMSVFALVSFFAAMIKGRR